MDANGAANIIFRREIDAAEDPVAKKAELVEQYSERFANPYNAGERGYVDDVIDPRDTRRVLVESLEMLRSKKEKLPQRKHGNVPPDGGLRRRPGRHARRGRDHCRDLRPGGGAGRGGGDSGGVALGVGAGTRISARPAATPGRWACPAASAVAVA